MEPAQLSDQVRVGHLGAAGQHQVLTRPAPRTAPKGRETTVGKSQKTPPREFDCITFCVPSPLFPLSVPLWSYVNAKKVFTVPGVIYLKMASVVEGISCTGPLGGKQGNFALS